MGKRPAVEDLDAQVAAVARIATAADRQDLVRRLGLVSTQARRTSAAVAVVGEFKQGKTLLINGILGEPLLPVDDDLATSVLTAVSYGEEERFVLHGAPRHGAPSEPLTRDSFVDELTEARNPGNRHGWRLAEAIVPNPVLEAGFSLLDTPGIGGAGAGYAAAISAVLPAVDAVLFISDASTELTRSEVDFLEQARAACPFVAVALTKIDLYPEWRAILELNAGHLAAVGIDVAMHPVSALLRMAAVSRMSAELNEESGYPSLLATLADVALHDRQAKVTARMSDEIRRAIDELRAGANAELRTLQDAAADPTTLQQLAAVEERLRELQRAGARWQTILAEGIADVRAECEYALRTAIRELLTDADRRIDEREGDGQEASLSEWLQVHAAARISEIGAHLASGADDVGRRIMATVSDTIASPQLDGLPLGMAVIAWPGPESDDGPRGPRRVLDSGLGLLRGVQGGAFMIGFFGTVMGMTVAMPISLAVGSAFGIKQLVDQRRHQNKERRAQLKAAVRQALERLQFEAGTELQRATVRLQRAMRDHFEGQIAERLATTATIAASLRRAAEREQGARADRVKVLHQVLSALDRLPLPEPAA